MVGPFPSNYCLKSIQTEITTSSSGLINSSWLVNCVTSVPRLTQITILCKLFLYLLPPSPFFVHLESNCRASRENVNCCKIILKVFRCSLNRLQRVNKAEWSRQKKFYRARNVLQHLKFHQLVARRWHCVLILRLEQCLQTKPEHCLLLNHL